MGFPLQSFSARPHTECAMGGICERDWERQTVERRWAQKLFIMAWQGGKAFLLLLQAPPWDVSLAPLLPGTLKTARNSASRSARQKKSQLCTAVYLFSWHCHGSICLGISRWCWLRRVCTSGRANPSPSAVSNGISSGGAARKPRAGLRGPTVLFPLGHLLLTSEKSL